MKKLWVFLFIIIGVFFGSGCSVPTNDDSGLIKVTIAAIPGVTPPAFGVNPVSTITETEQYTGIVAWVPGA